MIQSVKNLVKSRLELTLAIIKPDVCKEPKRLNEIREMILKNKFYFIESVLTEMSESEAKLFYCEHKDKFFYQRLISFMSSGVMSAHIIAKENAINDWRQLMGSTKVFKTKFEEPNTIRGMYGLTDTRNATHGSDSLKSFEREVQYFFPHFDSKKWFENEEQYFRYGTDIQFIPFVWIHKRVIK